MIIGLLCIALALALFCPQTLVGGWLKRVLVEWPARKLNGLSRTQILCGLLFAAAAALLIHSQNQEMFRVFGQGLAETANWFLLFDVGTLIDVIAMTWLVAAALRLQAARDAIRAMSARARQWALGHAGLISVARVARNRARSRRSRSPTAPRPKGDDKDGPRPDFGWALA